MTFTGSLIGALALFPAALNPSLMIEGKILVAGLCGPGGTISIPLGPLEIPGTTASACCAKGCQEPRKPKRRKVNVI